MTKHLLGIAGLLANSKCIILIEIKTLEGLKFLYIALDFSLVIERNCVRIFCRETAGQV